MKSKSIGKNIKYYREKNGMTQKELAEYLDVTIETIGRCERGVNGITLSMIVKLSKLFKIPSDYLLFGKNHYLKYQDPDDLTTALNKMNNDERKMFHNILNILNNMID